jgi:hypothetical protein
LVQAIEEGLAERKIDKEARGEEDDRDEFDRPSFMVDGLDDEEDTESIRKKALEKLSKVKKEEDRMADTNKRPRRGLAKPKK